MYKCKSCGRQFVGGKRRDQSQVITDYVEGKQTLSQLAAKYGVNEKTIRRDLAGMRYVHKISKDKDVTIQMDTTYWGRNFGLMVIKDAVRGRILWHKYVHHETIAQYVEGIDWLKEKGFRIYGAVIDGLKIYPWHWIPYVSRCANSIRFSSCVAISLRRPIWKRQRNCWDSSII